ncbi:CAAX prenyl protease [Tieghemiomyces parasiticus]|uniref:intramembrane prenyl-peptidase Rce1 n=1 Tax=Tieghemiomyces parasiticus TaxID=78921 RepID=A0A9W7ZUB3_9FUNG|nr:CAAX prenyl protease [Tieghemiomyces parasiticus]
MVAPVLQLSPEQAYALTAAHAVLFVGSLYVGRRTDLPRDHPRVIQARIGRVLGAIALSVVLTAWVAHQYRAHSDWTGAATFRALLHQGGFTNHNWSVALAWGLGSILTLFAGPLYVDYLAVRHQPRWPIVVARHWAEDLSTLVGWRNLVLAPLFEEAVFRGLVVPLWLNAGLSLPITVFASPVIFGLSKSRATIGIVGAG